MKRVNIVRELEERIVGEVQELTMESKPAYHAISMMLEAADRLDTAADLLHEREDFADFVDLDDEERT